jgi:RNA polymerase sigma-70 factor (ECF subfamily)
VLKIGYSVLKISMQSFLPCTVTFVCYFLSYFFMHAETVDKAIIGKVLQGDHQLFGELIKRYRHLVFTVAMRYVNTREDAEEIAQDVFIKAYRSLADFRQDAKFSTWLYAITTNTCITFTRKRKLETHSLADEKVFEQANAPEEQYEPEQKSKAQLLNKAIGLLSADDAAVITLFYKGDQSLEEIGRILGITPNNAKVKLHRARQRLKDKLEQHFAADVKEVIG